MNINLNNLARNFSGVIALDGEGGVSIYQCKSWWYFDINPLDEDGNPVEHLEIYTSSKEQDIKELEDFDLSTLNKESYVSNTVISKIEKLLKDLSEEELKNILRKFS